MKKDVLDFLSSLEGYHQVLKEIHWSTNNKSEHLLTDEIDEDVLEYEDKIAEAVMGLIDEKFGLGDLKTLLPEHKDTKGVLKELNQDVLKLKSKLKEEKYCGVQNILDDFVSDINKWNYLRTFK